MSNRRPALIILSVALLTIAAVVSYVVRQQESRAMRYFSETGTVVREPFLSYFNAHEGVDLLGLPLTNAYSLEDGTTVQVFENATLQLTVRGVSLVPASSLLALTADGELAQVDPAFADYYAEHGGEAFFGPAVGEARIEGNRLVQDFKGMRLVRDPIEGIYPARIGAAFAAVHPPPSEEGNANLRQWNTPGSAQFRARLSVEHPVVGQGDTQTVYLLVEDSEGVPVAGARGLLVLHFNDATAEVELSPTGSDGLSNATFVTPPAITGTQIVVEAHILVGESLLTVDTTYFQWW